MSGFGAALAGATAAAAPAAGAGAGIGDGAVAPAAGGAAAGDYRTQVLEIYNKYNKAKLGEVDTILEKYRRERVH